jgi:hypothetical protein
MLQSSAPVDQWPSPGAPTTGHICGPAALLDRALGSSDTAEAGTLKRARAGHGKPIKRR